MGTAGEAHCQGGGSSRGSTATRGGRVRGSSSSYLRGQPNASVPSRPAASGVGGGCGPDAVRSRGVRGSPEAIGRLVGEPKRAASATSANFAIAQAESQRNIWLRLGACAHLDTGQRIQGGGGRAATPQTAESAHSQLVTRQRVIWGGAARWATPQTAESAHSQLVTRQRIVCRGGRWCGPPETAESAYAQLVALQRFQRRGGQWSVWADEGRLTQLVSRERRRRWR